MGQERQDKMEGEKAWWMGEIQPSSFMGGFVYKTPVLFVTFKNLG